MDTVSNDASCQVYADPVGRLLTAGEAGFIAPEKWVDYSARYGFGHEHVPALIRMACDVALHSGGGDAAGVWAPVHAWRALGQSRASEAVEPLLAAMYAIRETEAPYDELAEVFAMIGPAAIAPISAFLDDRTREWALIATASDALTKIVARHPESRAECVAVLTRDLKSAADRDPTANGFTISYLLDLAAVESIDTIREAFRLDAVDFWIAGDVEDAEIALGLREHRSTPKPFHSIASRTEAVDESPRGIGIADDGLEYEVYTPAKVGRNQPCPCGSGKKYKKCCL